METGGPHRVVEDHVASYPVAMVARAGTRVEIDLERLDHPGWLWGSDQGGTAAWIPETYLETHGSVGRLVADYDSTELTVSAGEMVHVLEVTAGWSWCRHTEGRRGWIPAGNLTPTS